MSDPEAHAYLLAQLDRAHYVKTLATGVEQWRGPKPLRLRIRVERGVVVTVIPCCDTWREPRPTMIESEPWQKAPKAMAEKAAAPKVGVEQAAAEVQAAAGSAIRREDFVHAKLAAFKRRVDHTLGVICEAAKIGAVGVSFSGGKDSVCCVDLVRTVLPDAPAAFYDSGAELADTAAMVRHVNADTVYPRLSMFDMARYAGWWGHAAVDPDATFDAKRLLIDEPSETFVVQRGLRVMVHGVRASESRARSVHTASRGELYRGVDGTWYCMPLARWSAEDVWAYIASRGLKYHRAYDLMADAGMPRESWRVSGALGERGSGWGRHATLRLVDPETWRRLVIEFPSIGLSS